MGTCPSQQAEKVPLCPAPKLKESSEEDGIRSNPHPGRTFLKVEKGRKDHPEGQKKAVWTLTIEGDGGPRRNIFEIEE